MEHIRTGSTTVEGVFVERAGEGAGAAHARSAGRDRRPRPALPVDPDVPFGPPPQEWAKAQFLATSNDGAVEHHCALMGPESPRAVVEATQGGVQVDRSRISSPMLVVAVEFDELAPARLVRELAHHYGADHHYVPGCSHDLMLEPCWEQPAAYIRDWLRRNT